MANKAAAAKTDPGTQGDGKTVQGEGGAAPSDFDKLVGDLEILAKGGEGDPGKEGAAPDAAAAAAGAADAGKVLAKSLVMTDADGNKVEVEDASDLLKSLIDKVESFGDPKSLLIKALTPIALYMERSESRAKEQDTLIKSLGDQIVALGGQGRGRVAVVVPVRAAAAAKGAPVIAKGGQEGGINPNEFMAKAEAAFESQKITGRELGEVETYLNEGMFTQIPEVLVQRVMQATNS